MVRLSVACALLLGIAMSSRKTSLTEKQAKNGTSKYVLERCASINEYYDIAFKVCISVLSCVFFVLLVEQVSTCTVGLAQKQLGVPAANNMNIDSSHLETVHNLRETH